MEAIGVALHRVEEAGCWVVELRAAELVAEMGVSSRARICCSVSVGVGGADGVGSDEAVGVAVADDLEVEVVGRAGRGSAWCTAAVGTPAR